MSIKGSRTPYDPLAMKVQTAHGVTVTDVSRRVSLLAKGYKKYKL